MTISKEKQLIRHLLDHYESQGKNGRPVADHMDILLVNFSISLIQIMDVDEKNQVLKTNIWYHYVSVAFSSKCVAFLSILRSSFVPRPCITHIGLLTKTQLRQTKKTKHMVQMLEGRYTSRNEMEVKKQQQTNKQKLYMERFSGLYLI
jgi:hypothetical protein